MVRNTRLALACGLLTAVTVAMLGSRPLGATGAASLLPLPFAAGYALLRSEGWAPAEDTAPTTKLVTVDEDAPSLEGHRHPRGPRAGREASARTGR